MSSERRADLLIITTAFLAALVVFATAGGDDMEYGSFGWALALAVPWVLPLAAMLLIRKTTIPLFAAAVYAVLAGAAMVAIYGSSSSTAAIGLFTMPMLLLFFAGLVGTVDRIVFVLRSRDAARG